MLCFDENGRKLNVERAYAANRDSRGSWAKICLVASGFPPNTKKTSHSLPDGKKLVKFLISISDVVSVTLITQLFCYILTEALGSMKSFPDLNFSVFSIRILFLSDF